MQDCIFCKIAKKEIDSDIVSETDDLVVFKDIHPNAPIHFLIIPKNHIPGMSDVPDDIWLKMKTMMLELAENHKLKSFRTVTNWGNYQSVKHLHIHYTAGFVKSNF